MVSGSSPVSCVFALYIWILKLDNSDGIREMDPVSQSGCIYDFFLSTSIFKYNIVFNLYLHLSLIVTFFCFFFYLSDLFKGGYIKKRLIDWLIDWQSGIGHLSPFWTTRFLQVLQQEQAWLHSNNTGGSRWQKSRGSRPSCIKETRYKLLTWIKTVSV